MYCPNCGSENIDIAKYCFSCGRKLDDDIKVAYKGKNKKRKHLKWLITILSVIILLIILIFAGSAYAGSKIYQSKNDLTYAKNLIEQEKYYDALEKLDEAESHLRINIFGKRYLSMGYYTEICDSRYECEFQHEQKIIFDEGKTYFNLEQWKLAIEKLEKVSPDYLKYDEAQEKITITKNKLKKEGLAKEEELRKEKEKKKNIAEIDQKIQDKNAEIGELTFQRENVIYEFDQIIKGIERDLALVNPMIRQDLINRRIQQRNAIIANINNQIEILEDEIEELEKEKREIELD